FSKLKEQYIKSHTFYSASFTDLLHFNSAQHTLPTLKFIKPLEKYLL
ncbi:MAG: hypothetical protein ACI8Z9_001840, partial [Paraglaciecola sp.]